MTGPTVILDDDPTGAQASIDAVIVLRLSTAAIAEAIASVRSTGRAVHLMTNSRALQPDEAYRTTKAAAAAARAAAPDCRLFLRGDSTLRAHLAEEYLAIRDVAFSDQWPILVLVPALPDAGRITRAGIHYIQQDGRLVPVANTEYARDGGFSYTTSHLLEYAQQRSDGLFPTSRGLNISLSRVRAGPSAVLDGIVEVLGRTPAVFAPDAETVGDLAIIQQALGEAAKRCLPVITRCSPAMAMLLNGEPPTEIRPLPVSGNLLIVSGSYVNNTRRQLTELGERTRCPIIEADVNALAGLDPGQEIARLGAAASTAMGSTGLAAITTSAIRPDQFRSLAGGLRIATGLAAAAQSVRPVPSVVVTKGGITSAVVARDGFGITHARVTHTLMPGVAVWSAPPAPQFVIFPGNLGTSGALADLVSALLDDRRVGANPNSEQNG